MANYMQIINPHIYILPSTFLTLQSNYLQDVMVYNLILDISLKIGCRKY